MCGWSYLGFREGDEVKTIRTSWRKRTKVAWVDAEDVGVVVRAVVEDLCEGGGKRYRNKGVDLAVEAVTVGELAKQMARVLGEEVKVLYAEEQQVGGEAMTAVDTYPIAISQRWANEFDTTYGVDAARELGLLGKLTTMDEFLDRNKGLL